MSDRKVVHEKDVAWRRWEMTELGTRGKRASEARRDPAAKLGAKPGANGGQGTRPGQTRPAQPAPGAGKTPQARQTRPGAAQREPANAGASARPGTEKAGANAKAGRATAAAGRSDASEQRREAAKDKKAIDAERKKARDQGHREGRDAGHKEGYAQGLEEGRAAARAELEAEITETLKPLRSLATQFSEALSRIDDELANELVSLALATGRQMAAEALEASPEHVADLVRALLHSEPVMHGHPRLWLHPDDFQLVSQSLGQELDAAGWALQPDDQISRGGCRVTSESGELDATWESRWETVCQQVRRRRSSSEKAAEAQELKEAAEAAERARSQEPAATTPAGEDTE